nr:reverse transcriptase domain-containing protein [Tanacetum cinerariifolium]
FDEELEAPIEDQPLPVDASPTALLPGYIADSNPEEDEEDPEEDLADYPADEETMMIMIKNARNKRKWEGNHNGSSSRKNKGHKVPRAYTSWPINKKAYAGSLPLYNQCKFYHNGPCTIKCRNYKKVGHIIQNYRTPATTGNQQTPTCYECGSLRHYRSECPIAKFQKRIDMIHGGVRASKPKNNQNQQQPKRGKKLAELTLQGTGRRNMTADLSRCVLNATIAMMVHVLPNSLSATDLAICPMTVGVLQMPILLTTKGALG